MNIITISREFGSGGRELGKRLADALEIPCYDHEIIDMAAQKTRLSAQYIAEVSEREVRSFYPGTIGRRFHVPSPVISPNLEVIGEQEKIIRELGTLGSAVFVGRCSDVLLSDYQPFNIFVYADKESKIRRCLSRMKDGENLSEKEIEKRMKEIDKDRAAFRSAYTDMKWGDRSSYHLCINTSGKEIKMLISGIAAYIRAYYGETAA